MEANELIARIKADNVDKYECNLRKLLDEFKTVSSKLQAKDRGLFGLNMLRTLCWNLDKAPIWRDNIDNTALLTLAIDCIRETRHMEREDRVKTLACIYHIHKYAVRLNKTIPPELVLKISVMPFEFDAKYLLKEYHKTYWHILADRLAYMEKLKTKVNLSKLLPKVTEDILKILHLYNTVQFCSTIIVFLLKKLHMLYSETDAKKLVLPFRQIFCALCEKDDLADLKLLPEKDILDIYTKLNDCLYIVADNSSKMNYKDGVLDEITQKCAFLVAHRTDLFHCLQTFYINTFCKIISDNTNISYIEESFNRLKIEFQNVNKPEFEKALLATYPYLNQLLRLYIEHKVTNDTIFTEKIKESCLKLILFFMRKLKYCNQILKCDDCTIKSGLHDAFRSSLLVKHLTQNTQCNALELFYTVSTEQYIILEELKQQGCANHHKYFKKLQTDVHNTAISLNKMKLYEMSIKLFDLYLKHELKLKEIDLKNISRALFNKSICEMDSELYEKALINAFLSLTFAWQDCMKNEKCMSLVMDIKARELKFKSKDGEEVETDELQLVSILDACKMAVDSKLYGDIKPFLKDLKFSELLRHEFTMYAKVWPSMAPIAGVWRALHTLVRGDHNMWMTVENEATISEVLYDVVLETPSVVRTIHNPYFSTIVQELLDDLDNITTLTASEKLVHVALLFLQCEYDLGAASLKYEWKVEPNPNLDKIPSRRTVQHEHAATGRATRAVQLLRDVLPTLAQAPAPRVASALRIFQIFVPLLQLLHRDVLALQLAHYCCLIADAARDRECYLRNAGILVTSSRPSPKLDSIVDRAARWGRQGWGEEELVFLCDVAMYYKAQGKPAVAASLVQAVRTRILQLGESRPELNVELAVGRLLETQNALYGDSAEGPSALTAVNGALRHYLGLTMTGTKWSYRRVRSLHARVRTCTSALRACALARALGLCARARGAAAAACPVVSAPCAAKLHLLTVDTCNINTAQIKIDQHLKNILGLDPSNETQHPDIANEKRPLFTPRQELETMRDNLIVRQTQCSPTGVITSVPRFKIPDFFHHYVKCTCYACEVPVCVLICCNTSIVEAAMYAFANENEIARNYYQGVLNMIEIAYKKLKKIKEMYMKTYDDFIVESVMNTYELDFKAIQIRLLIDLAFYELKNNEIDSVDEHIIEINEIMQEMSEVDQYLRNEVCNLMAASSRLKKVFKKPNLDVEEYDNMPLSPISENIEPPKTPDSKPAKPPKPATKIVVKHEELPQNRITKDLLNLRITDEDDDDFEKPKSQIRGPKKNKFKQPNPIIPTPVLEQATPRPLKTPKLLLTEPSLDIATPISREFKENEFFTPIEATPEVFFTPLTSVKTYAKKSLRQNIVKNLEKEFLTPETSTRSNRTKNMKIGLKSTTKDRSTLKEELLVNKEKPAIKEEILSLPTMKEEKLKAKELKTRVREKTEEGKSIQKGENSKKVIVKEEIVERKSRKDKESLIRAVSPGKMDKDKERKTRNRRQL